MIRSITLLCLLIDIILSIRVRISTGFLEGTEIEVNGTKVNVFQSIPFAEPPIEDLRFQKPVPKKSWEDVVDTSDYAQSCPSSSADLQSSDNGTLSEDCLYLSVFADNRCFSTPCPVIFYVHGNIYQPFSSEQLDSNEISRRLAYDGIVFVKTSYRLGMFGFMDLGEEMSEAPFNVGLHDIILSLQWVQREILHFGGIPNRITLMGSSFGADLSMLLLHSPYLSANIIEGAIICSGFPRIGDGKTKIQTEKVVEVLGCHVDENNTTLSANETFGCIREKSTEEISQATFEVDDLASYWGPRFDRHLLPANDHGQLLEMWKPLRLLIINTAKEYTHPQFTDAREACLSLMPSFGYYSNNTLLACIDHYHATYESSIADAYHAAAVSMARLNTAKGQESYLGVMAEESGERHSGDLKYLIGLNTVDESGNVNMTEEDELMTEWYPKKIINFVKKVDVDWFKTDWHGASYYIFDFAKNENESEPFKRPKMIRDKYFNEPAVHFWLSDLAEAEDVDSDEDSSEEGEKLKMLSKEESSIIDPSLLHHEDSHEGASIDLRTEEEREEEVQTIWIMFYSALAVAITVSILFIIACLCCLRQQHRHRISRKYSP